MTSRICVICAHIGDITVLHRAFLDRNKAYAELERLQDISSDRDIKFSLQWTSLEGREE